MKTTNRLISLFAAMCISATMLAGVVYEHMLVDSGFNRDVIAEAGPSTQYAKSYLIADTTRNHWSMATQSVIRTVNTNSGLFTGNYAFEIETTAASGWPDDPTGDPANRIIHVEEALTLENPLYAPVTWQLAPYNEKNVLTIRPAGGETEFDPSGKSPGIQNGVGSLKFQKIGCYDKVFFLIAAAKEKGAKNPREVKTIVYYTDGDTTQAKFTFGGLSGKEGNNVRRINIYESQYRKNTHLDHNDAFAMVFEMGINPTKLISKIEFKNELVGTAVMIFAVTGRTADAVIPDAEVAQTSEIQNNQFTISWEEVGDAETYRVDVATDEDFQNMVGDYDNLEVSKNDTIVYGLEEDTDYYWRVRSVNDKGQSASSAPKHVKTAGGEIPETAETNENIEEELAPHIDKLYSTFKIDRTLWRDGYYNTLCLPFNMTPGEIAVSPLAGATIYKYVSAEKIGNNQLDIEVEDTTGIKAGVPYLIQWPNMGDIIPAPLEFHNVTIKTNVGKTIGGADDIKFVGNIGIATLVEEDENNLFLGANNTLYWPNPDQNRMKGFRAFFQIPATGPNAVPKNTPSRIVTRSETTTDIPSITPVIHEASKAYKVLINNNLYIIHNAEMYNLQGQLVK